MDAVGDGAKLVRQIADIVKAGLHIHILQGHSLTATVHKQGSGEVICVLIDDLLDSVGDGGLAGDVWPVFVHQLGKLRHLVQIHMVFTQEAEKVVEVQKIRGWIKLDTAQIQSQLGKSLDGISFQLLCCFAVGSQEKDF